MVLKTALALALLTGSACALAKANDYAEGQIWEYKTRPQDPGSLLKIQKISTDPTRVENRVIYHLSIIGVHLNDRTTSRTISHVPVSREALDDSVTRLSPIRPIFPAATDGIAEWRKANGGVFTVPIAQIIDIVENTMSKMPAVTAVP